MRLSEVNICKIFKYEYESEKERDEHKSNMITAQFGIVHENGLTVIYNQIIK
jgi:hypothetical protein